MSDKGLDAQPKEKSLRLKQIMQLDHDDLNEDNS